MKDRRATRQPWMSQMQGIRTPGERDMWQENSLEPQQTAQARQAEACQLRPVYKNNSLLLLIKLNFKVHKTGKEKAKILFNKENEAKTGARQKKAQRA